MNCTQKREPKSAGELTRKVAAVPSEEIVLVNSQELLVLEQKLDEEKKRSEEISNRILYLQADFENYKKRTQTIMQEFSTAANEKLISDVLDVTDELELSIKYGENSNISSQFLEGLKTILAKLLHVLEQNGLSKIEAKGKAFDPRFHQAIEKVPTSDVPEGMVVEEVRSGFTLGKRLLRPSLVKVSSSADVHENTERGDV